MTPNQSPNVSYNGDLTQLPAPHLFFSLYEQKETGALILRRERTIKKIFFRKGQPVYALSNLAREGLLRSLCDAGRLDLSRLESTMRQAPPAGPLADWLIETGLAKSDELRQLNRRRLQAMLIDVLHWHEGYYVYLFDQAPEQAAHEEPLALKQLVVESMDAEADDVWLWRSYRDQLDRRPILSNNGRGVEETLGLKGPHTQVLRLIDGENNLERIILGSGLRTPAALRVLWTLETFGLVSYPRKANEELVESDERAAELGVEGLNLIQRLQSHGEELLHLPLFEMLGISRTFTEEELRRGYYTIAQNYHRKEWVDKLPAEWRRLSDAIFERASNAFEALVVWEKRKVAGEFAPFLELDEAYFSRREYPNPAAEMAFLRGMELSRAGQQGDALDSFADARTLEPTEGDYRAWHAWLTILTSGDEEDSLARTSLAEVRRVATEDCGNVVAQELCALAHERVGKLEEAHEYFNKALRLAPGNAEYRAGKLRTQKPITAEELDATGTEDVRDTEKESQMKRMMEQIQSADYFTILGVDRDASDDEIRRKYFAFAKDFHPDHFKDSRLLNLAEQIFMLVNEAYETLSRGKKRRAYERTLRALESQKTMQQREQHFSVERMLQKGKALIQSNEWDAACRLFEKAMREGNPNDWRFRVYHAWARYNRDFRREPNAEREMEAVFQAALAADPGFVDVYLLQGKYYRRLEQWTKAKAKFDRVVALDADNMDAIRELRLISQRLGAETKAKESAEKKPGKQAEGKGILRSWFGRKQE